MAVYKLKKPVEYNGEKITEVTYPDELLWIHTRGMKFPPDSTDEITKIIVGCTKLPETVINSMKFSDVAKLSALITEKMDEGEASTLTLVN